MTFEVLGEHACFGGVQRFHRHASAVIGLPMGLSRLQAWLMERAPGEPLMSRDNLDSMAVDNVASNRVPGLAALGITTAALTSIAPGYLRKR